VGVLLYCRMLLEVGTRDRGMVSPQSVNSRAPWAMFMEFADAHVAVDA